jgi:hypothetical protein
MSESHKFPRDQQAFILTNRLEFFIAFDKAIATSDINKGSILIKVNNNHFILNLYSPQIIQTNTIYNFIFFLKVWLGTQFWKYFYIANDNQVFQK